MAPSAVTLGAGASWPTPEGSPSGTTAALSIWRSALPCAAAWLPGLPVYKKCVRRVIASSCCRHFVYEVCTW